MPQLGMDDNRLASVTGIPRVHSSGGIKNATPLMKRKELAVTHSEMIMVDQRAPVLSWPVNFGSVGIRPCSHTALRLVRCLLGDAGCARPHHVGSHDSCDLLTNRVMCLSYMTRA